MFERAKQINKVDFLRSVSIFANLEPSDLRHLADSARELSLGDGQFVFQQGDPSESLFVVAGGRVTISFYSQDGKQVTIEEIHAGEIFGEIELPAGYPRLTNGVAMMPTRVISLKRSEFVRLLGSSAFDSAFVRLLCDRLRNTLLFAESVSMHSLETRLARLLVRLSVVHGKNVVDGILIDRKISQNLIGQMINASRPKINVQMQAWKGSKVIGTRNGRIVILKPDALMDLSRQI